MTKRSIGLFLSVACILMAIGAEEIIKLPPPDKSGGKSLMQCLNERQSQRNMTSKDLTDQELSGLFWAAGGVNRFDGRRTNPTSRDGRDIIIYAAFKKGVYVYNPEKHQLELIQKKDLRSQTGRQRVMHSSAPVILIIISDYERMQKANIREDLLDQTADIHAGCVGQNVYLYAASVGLSTVIVDEIEYDKLKRTLNLPKSCRIIISMPVGKK